LVVQPRQKQKIICSTTLRSERHHCQENLQGSRHSKANKNIIPINAIHRMATCILLRLVPHSAEVTPRVAIADRKHSLKFMKDQKKREALAKKYLDLRLEYSKSDDYNPYSTDLLDIQESAHDFLADGEFELAIRETDRGLKTNRLNIRLLIIKAAALRGLHRVDEADNLRTMWMSLVDSILLNGDGNSFDTAFQVISIDEEHALLDLFKLKQTAQMLAEHNGKHFDVIDAVGDDGVETSMYFDIEIPIKWSDLKD